MDLYCVKCKARTPTINQMIMTTKSNRTAETGKCGVCGTNKFKFVSVDGILKKSRGDDIAAKLAKLP